MSGSLLGMKDVTVSKIDKVSVFFELVRAPELVTTETYLLREALELRWPFHIAPVELSHL